MLHFLYFFGFAAVAWCETLAPLMMPKDASMMIPDKYIVVFKASPATNSHASSAVNSASTALADHASWIQMRIASDPSKNKLEHSFNVDGLAGYTGYFTADLVDEIRGRGEVEYVEADQIMYAFKEPSANGMKTVLTRLSSKKRSKKMLAKPAKIAATFLTQDDAPWGLSRLTHEQTSPAHHDYQYPASAGSGVDVYIIDTGINVDHEDFEGRAKWGKTIPLFDLDIDGNGHGTHCAGTIGSKTYGVAKNATLIAVKVLRTSGFGTNSDVIKGVEWVTKQHRRKARIGRKSVANMSLGGGRSMTLERVVDKAVAAGVHFSVAAGNDAEDACEYSPAAAKGPITVGASTVEDGMAFFSNHGKCVDIFAPGLDIKSTWIGSPVAVNTISGTSMASPHVAGVLALYLGEGDWTPAALKAELVARSQKDLLAKLPTDGTPNALLTTLDLLKK
jgi:cerevisin